MTPWPEFRAVPAEAFARSPRMTVIDCWRLLSRQEISAFADIVYLGLGARTPHQRLRSHNSAPSFLSKPGCCNLSVVHERMFAVEGHERSEVVRFRTTATDTRATT